MRGLNGKGTGRPAPHHLLCFGCKWEMFSLGCSDLAEMLVSGVSRRLGQNVTSS